MNILSNLENNKTIDKILKIFNPKLKSFEIQNKISENRINKSNRRLYLSKERTKQLERDLIKRDRIDIRKHERAMKNLRFNFYLKVIIVILGIIISLVVDMILIFVYLIPFLQQIT